MSVRLDKWLWAARFFKTRSQAGLAIKGGRVDLDGARPKASAQVRVGSQVDVRKGPYRFSAEVTALAEKRRNAEFAKTLYREDEAIVRLRDETAARIAAERQAMPRGWTGGRPTKKLRRDLESFRRLYVSPEDIEWD